MTEHVTLDDLAALDAEIAGIEQAIDELRSELAEAGYVLAQARARQHRLIKLYHDHAAAPLGDP